MDTTDLLKELNSKITESLPRSYLGLSQIGHTCYRYLQHCHYWTFKDAHTARINRLFNVGHDAESIMIDDLKKVGIHVTGEQSEIIGVAGHWKGHIDGEGRFKDCLGKPFLVEFKTHNDKSFNDVKKKGAKDSKPGHYGQMQSYMGYKSYDIALYMALNKNTSEYYFEWVPFDEAYFKESNRKEFEVISAGVLLPRIGNNSIAWFECKFCSAKNTCFGKKGVEQNCRTCQHSDVLTKGAWGCTKQDGKILTVEEQRSGCDEYQLDEMFRDQ